MKKLLCMAAILVVSAAVGFGGGFLSEQQGQKQEETQAAAPVMPELVKNDEQANYTLPPKKVQETEPVKTTGEWLAQDDGKYFYVNASGDYLMNGWEEIDDAWYCFDSEGVMVTGWTKKDGKYYYLDTDGRMRTGWIKSNEDGLWYYLNEDGSMLSDAMTPDGYYVNSSGVLSYNG